MDKEEASVEPLAPAEAGKGLPAGACGLFPLFLLRCCGRYTRPSAAASACRRAISSLLGRPGFPFGFCTGPNGDGPGAIISVAAGGATGDKLENGCRGCRFGNGVEAGNNPCPSDS
jgi:hypothetical protein